MPSKGKFASALIGAAATLALFVPAPAAADEAAADSVAAAGATCKGGFRKSIAGEGYLKYGVCTKTINGTKHQMVEGVVVDTRSNNIYLRATVGFSRSTAEYYYYAGSKNGQSSFETPWKPGSAEVSLRSFKD